MNSNKSIMALFVGIAIASATAVPPTINVTWNETEPPEAGVDFAVITDPLPATPDFPNVELLTGSDTWRVWSRDTDNTDPIYGDGIGDIGAISSPADDNFTVKLAAS